MPVTAGALITSVCINGSVGLACFSLFAILRQWKVTAKLYKPKRYTGAENVSGRKPAPLAQELPAGFISWIKPVWCYSESDVIDLCGLDVAVFFRMLQLGVKLFTFITLWCLLVVMPINMTGGYLERHKKRRPAGTSAADTVSWPGLLLEAAASSFLYSNSTDLPASFASPAHPAMAALSANPLGNISDVISTDLDLLTLSNVYPGSKRMWVHLVSTYVITLVALKLLWDLSRDISFKRAVFLAVQGRTGPGSSVLVTDVPGLEWGTPLNRLKLSWVKWLLPKSLFRHGFDSRRQQHQQQREQLQQQQHESDARQLTQPLLAAANRADSPASPATAAAAAAEPQPAAAPSGGSNSSTPSTVTVEVTAAGAAGSNGSNNMNGSGATDSGGSSGDDGGQQPVGPPVVKDVWQEAVEILQSNGGDVKELVQQEMARVYGADNIAAVVIVHDSAALDAAAAQFFTLQEQLEDVLDWYQVRLPPQEPAGRDVEAPGQRQTQQRGAVGKKKGGKLKRKTVLVVGARYGSWGVERYGVAPTQVDALEFYPAALQQRLSELQHLQRATLQGLPKPAAVVTFRRQLVATLAAASLHSYDEAAWAIRPAPAPAETLWASLGLRAWEVSLRQLAVWVAFWCLVLFYAPVVALIQAPVNMDNLMKIPFLRPLLELPLLSSVIQGFLPSLVLLTFLAVLPYTLAALISRGGLHSLTAEDSLLTLMYFLFQLFAVFIFSFVSGTALSQLQALIDNPHRLISLLGVSAPQQASFFSTYILLLGLSRMPIQLLRLPQLALYLFQLQLTDSPRQRRRLWANQEQLIGRVLPLHTLTLLLGLVFCVASPLIAPFTLLYFVSSSICQRYQWLYVYRHPYEGAGTLWKQVFTQVLVAVYFFVAIMGCLLGIKRFEAALLLLPLAIGVLVFHVLAGRLLERPLTLPASREAAAMDAFTLQQQQQQNESQKQQASADDSTASSTTGGKGDGGDAAAGDAARSAAALVGLPNQVAGVPPPVTQDELAALYTSPAMKLSAASLQPLLDEAADVDRRLRAAGY